MGEISLNVQLPSSSKKAAGLETQRQRAASAELLKEMKTGMSPARLASSLSTEDFKAAWENLEAFLESTDEKNTPENLGRLEEVEARSRFAFQELKNPVMEPTFLGIISLSSFTFLCNSPQYLFKVILLLVFVADVMDSMILAD